MVAVVDFALPKAECFNKVCIVPVTQLLYAKYVTPIISVGLSWTVCQTAGRDTAGLLTTLKLCDVKV